VQLVLGLYGHAERVPIAEDLAALPVREDQRARPAAAVVAGLLRAARELADGDAAAALPKRTAIRPTAPARMDAWLASGSTMEAVYRRPRRAASGWLLVRARAGSCAAGTSVPGAESSPLQARRPDSTDLQRVRPWVAQRPASTEPGI
jgi:hypothetical protein